MAFTFDPSTDRGKVRLLIQDDDETYSFFTDAKIDAFLTIAASMEGLAIFNASALALEAWASNQVMVLKVTTHLDTSVDGAAVAREMRARAAELKRMALDSSTDSGFEIAELGLGVMSWAEQLQNEVLRG